MMYRNTLRMSAACRWTRQLRSDILALNRGLCSSASLSKKEEKAEKKVFYNPQTEIRKESWNAPEDPYEPRHPIPKGEWRGALHQFSKKRGASVELISYLQRGIDFRPSALKKWWGGIQNDATSKDQTFKPDRVAALGFDLGAAHFIVHRGGRVRFKDAKEWVQQDEDGVYDLARHYRPGVFIEEIDARGTDLVYEGVESMMCVDSLYCDVLPEQLKYLKSLNVAGCPMVDDWCIDRLCGEYHNSLQHLDLSGCTRVTQYGIGALTRLRHLRSLNLHALDEVKNIKLLCLLLLDAFPHLEISGISYLGQATETVQQA
ncbi:Distal membrane-arm assembly complex protein 2 [Chionoecetes opilio]|uniref:Distal membrane-arm assembly complex protein 2 n=1 Tax=Chionoecetes opilio TaxID=41210 RepID=A0A8J4XN39_CHIOP|nr:Distal membrane-arm assembly complex protein 2 [Chionoecetes opilio]